MAKAKEAFETEVFEIGSLVRDRKNPEELGIITKIGRKTYIVKFESEIPSRAPGSHYIGPDDLMFTNLEVGSVVKDRYNSDLGAGIITNRSEGAKGDIYTVRFASASLQGPGASYASPNSLSRKIKGPNTPSR